MHLGPSESPKSGKWAWVFAASWMPLASILLPVHSSRDAFEATKVTRLQPAWFGSLTHGQTEGCTLQLEQKAWA